jgi:aminopeptidase YwaD
MVREMDLAERVAEHLRVLTRFEDRRVGGEGNRVANAYFAEVAATLGLEVERTVFDCLDWVEGSSELYVAGEAFDLHTGPYSLPCEVEARLVAASTLDELSLLDAGGRILLLHGPIASGQLMPKNFVWYNPEEHKRTYAALERLAPAAVIAATGTDPGLVGGQYPFPLFEDGDFDIPNAFITDVDGEVLRAHAGQPARLRIDSRRIDATGEQVVATKRGSGPGRIVISAHIDSRQGSPGALDNASGVATMLALAELLGDHAGRHSLEFVPFNGEDNYANPGEMLWAEANRERMDDIVLGINIDDSGQRGADNGVSLYGCDEGLTAIVSEAMGSHRGMVAGPQWYQGDHMILVQASRPCIAVASTDMERFMAEYAHTERDTLELADPELIATTARYLAEIIQKVTQ